MVGPLDQTAEIPEPDPDARLLVPILRAYAHEHRDGQRSPLRELCRKLMLVPELPRDSAVHALFLEGLAHFVRQPDLDLTAAKFSMWVNCECVPLEVAVHRLGRLRTCAAGTLEAQVR